MSSYSIFKGLSKAYVEQDAQVDSLFPLNFNKDSDFVVKIDNLDNEIQSISSIEVAKVLKEYNLKLGCGALTLNNIQAIEEGALAVVTGQQAGVFTGALYTVYKAITTIKLAKKLSEEYQRPIVPIFWIASEDHDFQEIHQLKHYANGKLNTYSIDKEASSTIEKYLKPTGGHNEQLKASIGHLKVTETIYNTVEDLLNQAAQDEIENLQKLLKSTLVENDTLSTWFGRLMAKLFNEYGLVFVDPMLSGLRNLEVPMFDEALTKNSEIIDALTTQTNKVTSLGYKPSIDFDEKGLNLFYYLNGERLPIKKDDESWFVSQNNEVTRFTDEELRDGFKNESNRFSTNVILRPVVQDYLFKTIAYVAGPGEVSYYGQLSKVYEAFGKQMPIIYPRENFTVITEQLTEKMNTLDVDAEALLICGVEAVRDRVLDVKDDIRIDSIFEAYQKQVSDGYDALIAQIESISPEIHEFKDKNKGMILNQIGYLQEKAHRFHRRNHKDILKILTDIELQVIPEGGIQERTLSVLQYYGKQGDSFIDYLVNEIPLDVKHRIITI